ncbi:MAG: D-tyrosyl-tRNA(Tyr) deacylase [Chitinophagales bacterium]|nr:D-tyrosyl-tRNA(Tyr) deacylase [Chitinophagales bacterium]
MKVVIQRVTEASVTIDGQLKGAIGKGLLLLIGIAQDDSLSDITWTVRKIAAMRIFNDADNKMNLSLKDINAEVLAISQFTLYADTKKGNRPSFVKAAPPAIANELYEQFLTHMEQELGQPIQSGIFGADMKVRLLNDGPVTILLDSKNEN